MALDTHHRQAGARQAARYVFSPRPHSDNDNVDLVRLHAVQSIENVLQPFEVLVHVAAAALPMGSTQIFRQDAETSHLTWGFVAAVVSMALQWHSTSVLRFRFR